MTETIDITPVVNEPNVLAYAEKHKTDQPWVHVSGQLAALAGLAEELNQITERCTPDAVGKEFVRAFGRRHSAVSNEFLRMFGESS